MSERVALVTGAAQGIGRATAQALHASGHGVVYLDRDGDRAEAACRTDGGAMALAADVADEASVAAAMARVGEAFGRLDVLVNNAGICTLDLA
ncbi:MAG: SDR family NAD(P)-dependent oxidoreductase, partial [Pseudomonadota bacterium]